MSYDLSPGCNSLRIELKGHQIIGELRPNAFLQREHSVRLKGHQIIGELRLGAKLLKEYGVIERSPDHWWVTTTGTSLVSRVRKLKGHQIIGELRHSFAKLFKSFIIIERSPDHWWVTTARDDKDTAAAVIERSPDHWWVTTNTICLMLILHQYWKVTRSLVSYDMVDRTQMNYMKLKGHQIIGELRRSHLYVEECVINWKVTRSLVSYDKKVIHWDTFDVYWKVTRSLVSYDKGGNVCDHTWSNWKVTRSLVSYDFSSRVVPSTIIIERSPDHWWVTTHPSHIDIQRYYWKVTRSLVSYDLHDLTFEEVKELKGHQIIGELRPLNVLSWASFIKIERSPDHWWVTTELSLVMLWSGYWKVTRSLVSYDSNLL